MASDDFTGVYAALDKSSYAAGETIRLTVSGQNRHTSDSTTTQESVTVTAVISSAGGVQHSLTDVPMTVSRTAPGAVTLEDVTIVSVADTGGRTWSVSGRNATAVA